MSVHLYDLAFCTCEVTASKPVLSEMEHYVAACRMTGRRRADFLLRLRCDPGHVESIFQAHILVKANESRWSHPQQRYDVWRRGGRQVLLPVGRQDHVILLDHDLIDVIANGHRLAATIGVRVLRQMILRGGEASGGLSVHAGAVRIGNNDVLVGGRPGAGKTSILTELVETHGADLVSNDRTVLTVTDVGHCKAIPVPLAWRFTPEGLSGSPTLAAATERHQLARGRDLVDGKIELTPLEVSRFLHKAVLPAAEPSKLFVLVRGEGPPRRLTGPLLRKHLGFGGADQFAHDWLDLARHFGETKLMSTTSPWATLQAEMPARVLSWLYPPELPVLAAAIALETRR